MIIKRLFTKVGENPYDMCDYVKHDVDIRHHATGKSILRMTGMEVPAHWSTNARNTLVSKYFRKAGVPKHTTPQPGCQHSVPDWLRPHGPSPTGSQSDIGGETSVKQVIHRIVGHWTFVGYLNGYFDVSPEEAASRRAERREDASEAIGIPNILRGENAKAFYDEMVYMFLYQMGAPNSPQWFNTGLWWAYGIEGSPQGHWYIEASHQTCVLDGHRWWADEPQVRDDAHRNDFGKYVVRGSTSEASDHIASLARQSPNAYQRVQAHACYIIRVEDSMMGPSGIYDWIQQEARIFKYGSGAGANLSNLRAKNERLSGGGKSSGMMSWMRIADVSAGAIKSGGTTRRAAKMACLNIDHPDIADFINCKVDAELKVAAMHVGSKAIHRHCGLIMEAAIACGEKQSTAIRQHSSVRQRMKDAAAAGVPHNYIDRAIQLVEQGVKSWPGDVLDLEYEGECYSTVPFQNANNSVRVDGKFLQASKDGRQIELVPRTGGQGTMVSASELEDKIAYAAWFCADPGVQYDDIINDWNVTPKDGRINASNPCSEHMRLDNSACNLASLNLMRFVDDTGVFMIPRFRHAVRLWTIALDITNTMAHLPSKESAISTYLYRDIGLGFASLGAVLMSAGIAYDSPEAIAYAGAISALMHGQANLTCAEMASSLGPYPRFARNADDHLRCMANHMVAAGCPIRPSPSFNGLTVTPTCIDWSSMPKNADPEFRNAVNEVWTLAFTVASTDGMRCAEATVIAPTGTIAIVMDCDTTGIEPMLGLLVQKTLAGGGTMMVAPAEALSLGLKSLGYSGDKLAGILASITETRSMSGLEARHQAVFDTSFPDPKTGRSIPWQAHIRMMGAVQAFISGAISKTVNMPHDATIQDVRDAYRMGYYVGAKSIAIYRDGSKLSQPLVVPGLDAGEEVESSPENPSVAVLDVAGKIRLLLEDAAKSGLTSPITSGVRVRLPSVRTPGINVAVSFGLGKLYVSTVRYDDGKLGEVWIEYSADQGIVSAMMKQLCKLINVSVQYGVPPEAILKTMMESRFEPYGMVGDHPYIKTAPSVINLAARIIAYHELGDESVLNIMPDVKLTAQQEREVVGVLRAHNESRGMIDIVGPTITSEMCPSCGSPEYIPSGAGCKRCVKCGYSGGCG